MAILRLPLIVCLLGALSANGTFAAPLAGSWSWRVNPASPSAGDTMTVRVYDAPSTPVKVSIYIGGVLKHSWTLSELPGSVSYDVPAGTSGQAWEVVVSDGSSNDARGGHIG